MTCHVTPVKGHVIVATVLTFKGLLTASLYTFTNVTSRLLVAFTLTVLQMFLEILRVSTGILFALLSCLDGSIHILNRSANVRMPGHDLFICVFYFSHDFGLMTMSSL